jgi:hypothetical protein
MCYIINREASKNGDENGLYGAQTPAHHDEESKNCMRADEQQGVSSTEPRIYKDCKTNI